MLGQRCRERGWVYGISYQPPGSVVVASKASATSGSSKPLSDMVSVYKSEDEI